MEAQSLEGWDHWGEVEILENRSHGKSWCLCRQGILGRFNHCRSVIMGRSLNYWKSGIRTDWAIIERVVLNTIFWMNLPSPCWTGVGLIWRLNYILDGVAITRGRLSYWRSGIMGKSPCHWRRGILERFNHWRSGIINHWRSGIRTDWAIIERWVLETSF